MLIRAIVHFCFMVLLVWGGANFSHAEDLPGHDGVSPAHSQGASEQAHPVSGPGDAQHGGSDAPADNGSLLHCGASIFCHQLNWPTFLPALAMNPVVIGKTAMADGYSSLDPPPPRA